MSLSRTKIPVRKGDFRYRNGKASPDLDRHDRRLSLKVRTVVFRATAREDSPGNKDHFGAMHTFRKWRTSGQQIPFLAFRS